ncbi:MAG: xanthine dehydrogenase family protein molybdopterin-binding subunit [Gemmatimonadota bacterium]|nr:xanthine dehydrogenase family protein molybdopterin-binding subunit [Gemmatimonadota bacterium]
MSESGALSRRSFVKVGVVAGAGLTLGVAWRLTRDPGLPTSDSTWVPNAYLRIDEDGSITVLVPRSEMGQGVSTALPQLVAEELDVPWDAVSFEFAQAHDAYGMMVTGGSTSVRESWEPLRRAGATAREMLRRAGANRWGVDVADVSTGNAAVIAPDGSTASYGALAAEAARLDVPDEVALKEPADYRLIGTSVPRLDVEAKSTGRAIFGIDAGPPDTRVAVVERSPVFGGVVRSLRADAALALPGVDEIVELESGVAVVANGYVAANAGRDALEIEWDEGDGANLDDATIADRLRSAVRNGRTVRDDGDVDAVLAGAEAPIRAEYRLPYLAHATMEPMNCTAWVRDGRCTVWTGTQFQNAPAIVGGGARQVAAAAAGVPADATEVHTTFLGGGFGRRSERDFVREAAELAGKIQGPVKVVWSREDDMRHDFYRPASYHELTAVLGEDGRPAAWDHRTASQSIMERLVPGWVPGPARNLVGKRDSTSTEGASDQPYESPNVRLTYAKVDLPIPVGFWRSVGHTHTGFVVESFIDELAHAAGEDPYEYRRALLSAHPRHVGVLDAVAEASAWGSTPPEGRGRGIAVVRSFGSYVAQVAEVSIRDGQPRVHQVWCAVDCGTVLNPAIVRAQMESGIVYGLTAALFGEINIEGGRVVQSNFHDYRMLRMNEAPRIDVVLAPSGDAPGGVGEPGTPPIAPAVANAVYALTGERIRTLPIRLGSPAGTAGSLS